VVAGYVAHLESMGVYVLLGAADFDRIPVRAVLRLGSAYCRACVYGRSDRHFDTGNAEFDRK
jgi:hypothetical protein